MQLEHAQDFHVPASVPPTPDTVRMHLEAYHQRARRLLLSRVLGRNKRLPLLSVAINPSADSIERVGALVTARAKADEDETGEPACYALQLELENVEKKPKAPRVTVQFWLGPEGEIHDHAPDPMQFDGMMLSHIKDCWSQINEQANTIARLGEVALERCADAFVRERQALEIVADAKIELEAQRLQSEIERAKIHQNDQLLEVIKPAAQAFATQAGARMVAGAADRKRLTSEQTKPATVATTATPTPAAIPAQADDDDDDELDALKASAPLAYVANVFGSTIGSAQWFELVDVLTKKQIVILRSTCKATDDDETMRHFAELAASFKPGQRERLDAVLDGDQRGMIVQLWLESAKRTSARKDQGKGDGAEGDAES